jgi:hypothetical protein
MPDDTAHQNKRRYRHGISVWRLLAFTGLVAGIATLFQGQTRKVSGRGSPGTPPSAEALAAGYEPKDIGAVGVALILAGMAASTALVIGVVFAMTWRFDINRHATMAHLTSQETARVVPPAPHLQRNPFADLARVQSREARLLASYGWISADHSLARIPIDRAMALSVGKSLDQSP